MAYPVFKVMAAILVIAFGLSKCSSEARQARNEFIAGCTQGGSPDDICECAADEVFQHYGDDDIKRMQSNRSLPPDFARTTLRAMAQCVKR